MQIQNNRVLLLLFCLIGFVVVSFFLIKGGMCVGGGFFVCLGNAIQGISAHVKFLFP